MLTNVQGIIHFVHLMKNHTWKQRRRFHIQNLILPGTQIDNTDTMWQNEKELVEMTEQFWKAKMPAEVNGIVNRADHQIRR